jgi:hypothetical protein
LFENSLLKIDSSVSSTFGGPQWEMMIFMVINSSGLSVL